jgi:outer membrane protein assembly factor BamB
MNLNKKSALYFFSGLVLVLILVLYQNDFNTPNFPNTHRVIYYGIDRTPTWSTFVDGNGTFSSPRVADLNNDGVGDIILGAGRQEFQVSDTAMMAIDGKTGNLIWKRSAENQVFGSALLYDIDRDGIEDVIFGGRNGILDAISGRTGKTIWEFSASVGAELIGEKYFNFYNPQLIPDQDGDGLMDILVANGGNVLKQPYDPDRPVGYLLVISSAEGTILQEAAMPDSKETYQSAVLSGDSNLDEIEVAYGTGGETIGGSFYVCKLTDVLEGDLSNSKILATNNKKGFIAPPVWVDINGDGKEDLIGASVDGEVYAFNGTDMKEMWKAEISGTEIYSTPAIGFFKSEDKLDIYVTSAIGTWPNLGFSKHTLIDGKNGSIIQTDTLGYFQSSSPLVVDLNGDGVDEVFLSVNYESFNEEGKKIYQNTLFVIDFLNGKKFEILDPLDGQNIASTPWIGDMDRDGQLDIVFCHSNNLLKGYAFDGMLIHRLKTNVKLTRPITWGSYMGSQYNGRATIDFQEE